MTNLKESETSTAMTTVDSFDHNTSILDDAKKRLEKVAVTPINCNFDIVTESTTNTVPVPTMTKVESKRAKGNVTVVFAVRSPGCGACREHAVQLKELTMNQSDVALVGVIKETGPHVNRDVLDFYQQYFRFPIYKDDKWGIYKALGNRRLSMTAVFLRLVQLKKRVKSKNIVWGDNKGEGFTLGGVLIFDKKGSLHYTYNEKFGVEMDMDEIQKAIDGARMQVVH